jgi:CheY-like chemotaxis protein
MDGFEATRRLKAQARFRDLPIIALTANVMPSDRQRCVDAGMDGYLAKPVNTNELFKTLSEHIVQAVKPPPSAIAELGDKGPTVSAPSDLPGIDSEIGLTQANGKPELYRKLLRGFRDKHALDFEADYRLALAAEDWETAIRRAHSLKGVAKTIGAFSVGQRAAELETATREQNHESIATALADLLPELTKVRSGLLGLESASASRDDGGAQVAELRPLIALMRDLLEQRDVSVADQIPALRVALMAAGRVSEADTIATAIGQYDFARAAGLLKKLSEAT